MKAIEEFTETVQRIKDAAKNKEEEERWVRLEKGMPVTFEEEDGQQLLYPRKCRVQGSPLITTALFRCSRRRERLDNVEVAAQGKWQIRVDGETFTQHDELVFMELVNRANWAQSRTVRFSMRSFMREIGLTAKGGGGAMRVEESLLRLASTTVELKDKTGRDDWGIKGPLAAFAMWKKNKETGSKEFIVELNKPWFWMLSEEGYTIINWGTHRQLSVGLHTWMHRFALRHQTATGPKREGLANLLAYTGMKSSLRSFRLQLKGAMTKLAELGVVESWSIQGRGKSAYLEFTKPLTEKQKARILAAASKTAS
jgi:hypothetical protein